MYHKIIFIFLIIFTLSSCSKKEEVSFTPPDESESYKIYKDALDAMNRGNFFYAAQKFSKLSNFTKSRAICQSVFDVRLLLL